MLVQTQQEFKQLWEVVDFITKNKINVFIMVKSEVRILLIYWSIRNEDTTINQIDTV